MSSPSSHDPDSPEDSGDAFGGNSGPPIGIILGIVALSVVLFFAVTLPKCSSDTEAPTAMATPADQSSTASAPDGTPKTTARQVPTPVDTSPAPSQPEGYSDPLKLLSAFSSRITQGNLGGALDLVDASALRDHGGARLRALFNEGKYKIAEENPITEIGDIDDRTRFAIKVVRQEQDGLSADETKVLFDMVLETGGTWSVDKVHVPTFTALAPGTAAAATGAIASLPDSVRSQGASEGIMVVRGDAAAGETTDPLQLAHAFVTAVTNLDFEKARSLLDLDKVTEEKLTGLLIVSEEAKMEMREKQPLIATATKDDRAWIIAQLEAEGGPSVFGLELSEDPKNPGNWKIAGLNFSKLIADQAAASGADAVTYTPLVETPQGGDSLVLYFEYDVGELHMRARRQLEIIAKIMRGDPTKKIHINGHADAMGTENYNIALSDTRAAEVKRGLIDAGVRPDQIVTTSFGESRPLSPNVNPDGSDNPIGRKRNRRAEVYLDF